MAGLLGLLKWLALAALVVWGIGVVLDRIGPTVPMRLEPGIDADAIAADPEGYLAASEAGVPNLRPAARKRIVWAGDLGAPTDWAVVYLHGFSASAEELRPVPDRVADALGANLHFTRLAGHGRDGAAMAEPEVGDWVDDVAEAMAVGRAIGTRVLLIGTSTGATLATLAAADPDMSPGLAGVVLVSPNYRVAGLGGRAVEWPGAATWGPWIVGAEREIEPVNAEQAAHWTLRYPTRAVAPLGGLVHHVRGLDFGAIEVPALVFVSSDDRVIDPATARRRTADWGGGRVLVPVPMGPDEDPGAHVLAGDILSPARTVPVSERIVGWARGI